MSLRRPTQHTVAYVLKEDSISENSSSSSNNINFTTGHCLGVNSLFLDIHHNLLYSGGRDGSVIGWNVPTEVQPTKELATSSIAFSSQHHSDWINDLIVCHKGNSVFTASSDRTVKLWKPHQDPKGANVELVGYHTDFVKCLSYASTPQWLCSGGLDGKIHIWDVAASASPGNNLAASLSDPTAPHASYYACAVGKAGRLVAGGSPDGIIRLWDPRVDPSSGTFSHFTGHTDSVRALLMSNDNRWILSASSDSTIKLWSLASQRCVKTYTMHTDPVWCLFTADPDLRQFYAGSRSGLVTKTLIPKEVMANHRRSFVSSIKEEDPADLDDDDSNTVVVCRESNGITNLVATPNHAFLWTSTTKSSIHRWADVAPAEPECGLGSLLTAVANINLDSTAKLKDTSNSGDSDEEGEESLKPIRSQPLEIMVGRPGLIKCQMLSNRRQLLTLDSDQHVALWDIVQGRLLEKLGPVDLEATFNKLNPMISVPNWCTVDTKIGALTVRLDQSRCFDAEVYRDEVGLPIDENSPGLSADDQINLGRWVLKNLFSRLAKLPSPSFPPQIPLPPIPISREPSGIATPQPVLSHEVSPANPFPVISASIAAGANPSPPEPSIPGLSSISPNSPSKKQFYGSSLDYPNNKSNDESNNEDPGSPPISPTTANLPVPINPPPPVLASTGLMGRLRQFSVKKLSRSPDQLKQTIPRQTFVASPPPILNQNVQQLASPIRSPTNPSPLNQSPGGSPSSASSASSETNSEPDQNIQHSNEGECDETSQMSKQPVPSSESVPDLDLSEDITLILSEESGDVSGCIDIYSGKLASQAQDQTKLMSALPTWIADCVFKDRIPVKEHPKIGFLLRPLESSGLSSLPSNARLLAGRGLRCKKLAVFLWEKLSFTPDKLHALLKRRQSLSLNANSIEPTTPTQSATLPPFTPENWIVLTCNDQVLDPLMTLATIRQFIWRAGGDVVISYDIQPRYSIPVKV